jgi:DNA-binding beta-propeller fold protein YncE
MRQLFLSFIRPLGASLMLVLCLPATGAAEDSAGALRVTQAVSLPHLGGGTNHLAADAKRGRFFVTAPGDKKVVVADIKAGKELRVLTAVPASAAAFLADLDNLCLSGGGGVTFYDGDTLTPLARVDLGSSVDELRYDSKQHRLYAGLMDADKVGIAVIDAARRTLVAKLKLPAKPQGFEIEQNGSRLYANTPGAGQVTVLDREQNAVVAEWKLTDAESNYPVALDEANHRLFVGCRRPTPRMLVIDTSSGKTVAQVDCGADADDMSFDATHRCAYLACGAGVITGVQQVDADHYRRLPDTPTVAGARNGLFVPELQTFFLAVPGRGNEAGELRAYQMKK